METTIREIEKYLSYLFDHKGYSLNSINSYKRDLYQFNDFLLENNCLLENVNEYVFKNFLAFLHSKQISKKSINRKIISIRGFYNYYCKYINSSIENPIISVSLLKTEKALPKDLFLEQIKSLMVISEPNYELGLRNQSIVYLLFQTGMRVSEICNITLDDVDLDENIIRVIGKGNKERRVYFKDSAKKHILNYLQYSRPTLTKNNPNIKEFFVTSTGKKIMPRAIQYLLQQRASLAPVPFKVSPHMIRHTFATQLLNNDADLKMVQELLGHESLSTTQIYTHVSKKRLKSVYENSHPLAMNLNKVK